PVVLQQAKRGTELQLGNLATRRDYVYAEDVAAGLTAMAVRLVRGDAITCNLGTGRAVTGSEVLECVERVVGKRLTVRKDVARLRASDRPVLLSDSGTAQSVLGWTARTALENGLAEAMREPLAGGVSV